MKYQGIVITMTKNKAVVTTDDFECFYIKRSSTFFVGKEIEFAGKEIIRNNMVLTKLLLSAACITILFVIAFFSNLAGIFNIKDILSEPRVFAYVSVDINPSLELEIDENGKVLKLVPLNEDAKGLIKKLKIVYVSVSEAVGNIVDEVNKNKAVSEAQKDYILVSSTLNNGKNESDKEYQVKKKKLDNIMNSLKDNIQVKENGKVNVYLVQTNMYERKNAQSEGISAGRYVLYKKYKNLRSSFSIEAAEKINVNELLEDIKQNEFVTPSKKPDDSKQVAKEDSSDFDSNHVKNDSAKDYNTNENDTQINTPAPTPSPILSPTKIIDSLFMRFESFNYRGYYIRHKLFKARISPYVTPVEDSVFKIVPGLADPGCISFESKNFPGYYLKHENFEVILKQYDGTATFYEDATFRKVPGLADENLISFQSFNYPDKYIRHREYSLWIEEIADDLERKDATYFKVQAP